MTNYSYISVFLSYRGLSDVMFCFVLYCSSYLPSSFLTTTATAVRGVLRGAPLRSACLASGR